jgi:hypothetical protein
VDALGSRADAIKARSQAQHLTQILPIPEDEFQTLAGGHLALRWGPFARASGRDAASSTARSTVRARLALSAGRDLRQRLVFENTDDQLDLSGWPCGDGRAETSLLSRVAPIGW